MAATMDVDLVGDLGCDIFDFDIIDALDLDLSLADDEFRGGGACHYFAIFSDADIVSHCRHRCEDGDSDGDNGAAAMCGWLLAGLGDVNGAEEEEASSSVDSGITDDEPLTPVVGDATAAEAMSAYVAELERFLLGDDDEQAEVDQGLVSVVDDYFAGDHFYHYLHIT